MAGKKGATRGGSANVPQRTGKIGNKLEAELEEGLEESFPDSDAPAATQPVHKTAKKKRS